MEKIAIKDLGLYISDGNYSAKYPRAEEFVDSGIPFIRANNLIELSISDVDMYYISEEKHGVLLKGHVKPGDVLITTRGNLGQVALVPEKHNDSNINAQIVLLRSNNKVVNNKYLLWALQSKGVQEQILKLQTGTALKQLPVGRLEQIVIPLYELNKQKQIATNLELCADVIKHKKKQLGLLDDLVKSRFIELFMGKVYPTKTVDEVSIGKGEYGAQSASIGYDPTRPRYVRITDINDDGTLNDDVVASINPSDDEQYKLEYGDFMFARMGATVGKTYAFIEGNQIFAGYLIRYRLNPELINPRYLFWYTRLDEYWNWVKLNQSGAAQPGINAKKYGSLQIPLPPIEEQNTFAAFVEQTDKSKFTVQVYLLLIIQIMYCK